MAQILKVSKPKATTSTFSQSSATTPLAMVTLGTALDTSSGLADNKDAVKNRIEVLVAGVLEQVVKLVALGESVTAVESALFFLWMALKNNDVTDLQRELFDLEILKILEQIIKKHEKTSLSVLTLGIAVLRRLVTCTINSIIIVESLDFIDSFLHKNVEKYMKMAISTGHDKEEQKLYKGLLAKEILGCTGNALAQKHSDLTSLIIEERKDKYYFSKMIINLSRHYMNTTPKILKAGLINLINLTACGSPALTL